MFVPSRALALSVTALLLTSCSSRSSTSMDLLRSGLAGICVADDVEETLRNLILGDELLKEYTVTFENATLESFDKGVSKASCHADVRIIGPAHPVVESEGLNFVVAPSAQQPDSLIVSAEVQGLRSTIEADVAERQANQAQQQQDEQAVQELAALVKPGWLVGRWVSANAGSDTCTEGPFLEFIRGGALMVGPEGVGQWTLHGTTVAITGPSKSASYEITAADADSITTDDDDTEEARMRRCRPIEIRETEEPEDPVAPLARPPASPQPNAAADDKVPSIVTQ